VLDSDNVKARDEINALADEVIAMMPDTKGGER
jgi:hypothetical protein